MLDMTGRTHAATLDAERSIAAIVEAAWLPPTTRCQHERDRHCGGSGPGHPVPTSVARALIDAATNASGRASASLAAADLDIGQMTLGRMVTYRLDHPRSPPGHPRRGRG
jgi:hypothetical protein